MRSNRLFRKAAAFVLAAGLLTSSALACGGHHSRRYRRVVSAPVCYELCSVEGCESAGQHEHDGVIYCGYDHACGYCDGSCAAAYQPARHHGHCHG